MAYDKIRAHRENLANFVASVLLGGLAISFISSVTFAIASGANVNGYGSLLIILGFLFLPVSGYLYLRSQPNQLDEITHWDFGFSLRADGKPESNEAPSFDDFKVVATHAYQKVLASNGRAPDFGSMAEDLTHPDASIKIASPPGDRLGGNDVELFVSELIDYLTLYRLSWLPQDCFTLDGKLIPTIDFYRDADLETYQWTDIQDKLPDNRFLKVAKLKDETPVKLPKDLHLTIERQSGLVTKVVLWNDYIRIVVTHSVLEAGRTKSHILAKVRFFFSASSSSIWRPDIKGLARGHLSFPSDRYSRSVKPLLDNLERFFPPSQGTLSEN